MLAADDVVDDLEEFASLVWNVIRGYARWVDVLCITYVLTDYSMWEPEHTYNWTARWRRWRRHFRLIGRCRVWPPTRTATRCCWDDSGSDAESFRTLED